MVRDLKWLYASHFLMIRLAFQGWRHGRIAERVGVARETVSRVLHSFLAKAELTRMLAEAEDLLTDIPFQLWLANAVKGTSSTGEARRLARQLRAERRGAHASHKPGLVTNLS